MLTPEHILVEPHTERGERTPIIGRVDPQDSPKVVIKIVGVNTSIKRR